MPKYIVQHECSDGVTRYLIWSTIVDAPLTFGCSLDEIYAEWKERYGSAGLANLKRDIADDGFDKLDDVISCNRAGKDETRLSREQIVDFYFERNGNPDNPPLGVPWQQGDN